MAGAMDQACLVRLGELLFATADHYHLAVEAEQRGPVELRTWRTYHCVCFSYVMLDCIPGMPGCEPPEFLARLPPSIGMIAPVIHVDASDARKIASPLISSGLPKRPA